MHNIYDTEYLFRETEINLNDTFSLFFENDENQEKRQTKISVSRTFNKEACLQAEQAFLNSQMLLAENCSYSLNDQKTLLNHNALIVGASGTGKTTRIVSPNIEQAVGSYVISDPKGCLYKKYKSYLEQRGYKVRLVDFIHPEKSCHYNPLKNIRSTQDILKISAAIVNERASFGTTADPFWDSMTTMLISAIIAYMIETDYQPCNFSSILALVREGNRSSENQKKSDLSRRFQELRHKNSDSWACSQFENINQAPYKTYDTIRSTLAAKFAKFDTQELQTMMSQNDLDFVELGTSRTAIFVTVSDTDRSMDNLVNIFFTQAMQQLCEYADTECGDYRLPVPVRFILDDFATNCKIEEFPRMISSIRSRQISVMLMIQAESQLKQGYGEDAKTIISNCDTYMYLGGNDLETAETVSQRCNKPLSQILYMPVGNCWIFRRGSQPVYSKMLELRPLHETRLSAEQPEKSAI